MTIKGWVKVHQSKTWDEWINNYVFYVKSKRKQRIENKVKVIKTAAGWWQVWATSAPLGEIGSATNKVDAVKIAIKFMKKYPSGHPAGIDR